MGCIRSKSIRILNKRSGLSSHRRCYGTASDGLGFGMVIGEGVCGVISNIPVAIGTTVSLIWLFPSVKVVNAQRSLRHIEFRRRDYLREKGSTCIYWCPRTYVGNSGLHLLGVRYPPCEMSTVVHHRWAHNGQSYDGRNDSNLCVTSKSVA